MVTPEEGGGLSGALAGGAVGGAAVEQLQHGVKGQGVRPPWAGLQGSGLCWSEQGAGVFGFYSQLVEGFELYPECGQPRRVWE